MYTFGESRRKNYLPIVQVGALSIMDPKRGSSYDNVTILLMVRALVDTLHCPKICNRLIAIATRLYCHYEASGVESWGCIVSWEISLAPILRLQ